jgi:hypothetical protein
MKVYAIYNKENKFIACFPNRNSAEDYGVQTYGRESGWEYDIIEKYLHEYPNILYNTPNTITPYTPNTITPYTQPISVKTTPYIPNIWYEGPKATYEGETK